MRIVAGQYGGRRLSQPKNSEIRPTSDKVRGAMFNILRGFDSVHNARVLDLFCGTGALGLEALSQGAAHVTFVDKAKSSLDLARQNADDLGATDLCDFILKDAVSLTQNHMGAKEFDLVFMDPPYRKSYADKIINNEEFKSFLGPSCIVIIEVEKAFQNTIFDPYTMLQEKVYGDTKVIFLRYDAGQ